MSLSTDVLVPAVTTVAAERRSRLVVILVVGIALFAGFARIPRLHTPAGMIFDEIYYAKAAEQYLARQEITEERTHPPLSKLIIAAAIAVAGDNAVGWRIAPALAGVLLVPVVYALAMLLFRDWFVAAASALLVSLDGLTFVESRIAKPDIFLDPVSVQRVHRVLEVPARSVGRARRARRAWRDMALCGRRRGRRRGGDEVDDRRPTHDDPGHADAAERLGPHRAAETRPLAHPGGVHASSRRPCTC